MNSQSYKNLTQEEKLEEEDAFMGHCRDYAMTHPSSEMTYADHVISLWHSKSEREEFFEYRANTRAFIKEMRANNVISEERRKSRAELIRDCFRSFDEKEHEEFLLLVTDYKKEKKLEQKSQF